MSAVLDYRNAKYQGRTNEQQLPEGLGLLLDHNYLLSMSQWRQGKAEGPTLLVFPDSTLFQGTIRDAFPSDFCTYHSRSSIIIHAVFSTDREIIVAFDDLVSKTIETVSINQECFQKLLAGDGNEKYLA